jgi:hypothetical protein
MVIGLLSLLAILIPAGVAFSQSVATTGPAGVDLAGCRGSAVSQSSAGVPNGSFVGPGSPPASPDHPLVVQKDGIVPWEGSTDAPITDLQYQVSAYGIPVKSGADPNVDKKSERSGTADVDDYTPVPVVGLFQVEGTVTGAGGPCHGATWVKVEGSPIGTPAWIAGLVLLLSGTGLLFFSRPSLRPPKGV